MNRYHISWRVKNAPRDWGRLQTTVTASDIYAAMETFKENSPNAEGTCITKLED